VDLPHELEAVDARHLDVAEHEIEWLGGDDPHGLAGVSRREHAVADPDENPLEGASVELFVVDDQYVRFAQKSISGSLRLGFARGVAAEL